MTGTPGLRTSLRRMTSDALVSWPLMVGATTLTAIMAMGLGYSGDRGNLAGRGAASALSMLVCFGCLYIVWFLVLRRLTGTPRIIATLASFLLAGVIRGFCQQELLVRWGLTDPNSQNMQFRVASSATWVIVLLCAGTLAVDVWREFHRRMQFVAEKQATLTTTLEQVSASTVAIQEELVLGVREALDQAIDSIAASQPQEALPALRSLSDEVVRPLSRELSDQIPIWDPVPADPRSYRLNWRRLWQASKVEACIAPLTTVLILIAAGVGSLLAVYGWDRSVVMWIGSIVVLTPCLALAKKLALTIPSSSPWLRFVAVSVLIVIATLPNALLARWIAGPGPGQALTARGMIGSTLLMVWIVAVARRSVQQDEQLELQAQELDRRLRWLGARARMTLWQRHGSLSLALHGPAQTAILSTSLSLQAELGDAQNGKPDVQSLARTLRIAVMRAIDKRDAAIDVERALGEVAALWAGLSVIHGHCDPAALTTLRGDQLCSDATVSVMHEIVSNAIRHGGATDVRINIDLPSADSIAVIVTDDGVTPATTGTPGVGTRQLEACAIEWSTVRDGDLNVRRALLPAETPDRVQGSPADLMVGSPRVA